MVLMVANLKRLGNMLNLTKHKDLGFLKDTDQGRAPGGTEGAKLPGARPPSPRVTVASPRVVPPVGLVGDDGSPIPAAGDQDFAAGVLFSL